MLLCFRKQFTVVLQGKGGFDLREQLQCFILRISNNVWLWFIAALLTFREQLLCLALGNTQQCQVLRDNFNVGLRECGLKQWGCSALGNSSVVGPTGKMALLGRSEQQYCWALEKSRLFGFRKYLQCWTLGKVDCQAYWNSSYCKGFLQEQLTCRVAGKSNSMRVLGIVSVLVFRTQLSCRVLGNSSAGVLLEHLRCNAAVLRKYWSVGS